MSTKKKSAAERAAEIKALEARLAAAKEADKKATAAEEAKARAEAYKQLEAAAKEVGLDVAGFVTLGKRSIKAMQKYCSPRGKTVEAFIEQLENSEK